MADVELTPIPHKELPQAHPKPITMKLAWHHVGKFFIVLEMTNSSYYLPGERIPPDRIALINESGKYPNWTINVIDYDYFAAIGALIGGVTSVASRGLPLPL